MIIRQENKKDVDEVYSVVKSAFETAEHSDGTEQDLVVALRGSDGFIPQLSLVAEDDGKIIGHIMFTAASVNNTEILALAPLSVLPGYQKKGIGTALMKKGHEIAVDMGYEYSVVLGSEHYYPRVGYRPASDFGISAPFEVPPENFMAINLYGKDTVLGGVVRYVKEIFES